MVKPLEGFQLRGMIPVLGIRRSAGRRDRTYRRSRVRSPVRPQTPQFFLSLEATLPERPPYATAEPRGAHIINLPGLRTYEAAGAPVGTRDPRRSFADENERAEQPRKIQDPRKISPQSPRSPHLQNHHLPHNLR